METPEELFLAQLARYDAGEFHGFPETLAERRKARVAKKAADLRRCRFNLRHDELLSGNAWFKLSGIGRIEP